MRYRYVLVTATQLIWWQAAQTQVTRTRHSRGLSIWYEAPDSARRCQFGRINSRATGQAVIECFVTGLLAWRDGQPGQVGNEAATAVFHQCRGSGSSPSFFFCFSSAVRPISCLPQALSHRRRSGISCALHLFFSIGPLACFNEAATRVRAPSRFGFARHRY